jgi:hypothetical protein
MSCERYRALVSAYVDGDLTPEERARLHEHLRQCRDCTALLADYRQVRALMRGLGPLEPPPALRSAVQVRTRGRAVRRSVWVPLTRGLAAALVIGLLAAWPLASLMATDGGLAVGLARLVRPLAHEAPTPTPAIAMLPVEVPVTVTPPPTPAPPTATATAAPVATVAVVPSPVPSPPPTATAAPAPPTVEPAAPTAAPAPAVATAPPVAPAVAPTATPTSRPVAAVAPTATPRPPATATPRPAASPSPTPAKSPPATATAISPTATATPTRPASPTAPVPTVVGSFARVYEDPAVRSRLGLALQNERTTEALTQPFERGAMEWVADGRQIYVFYAETHTWARFADTWNPDEVSIPGDPPPAGLFLPSRSFGKLWRENPTVRERLGWATALEQSFTGRFQRFERGLMLRSPVTGSIYILYEDGAWQRFEER